MYWFLTRKRRQSGYRMYGWRGKTKRRLRQERLRMNSKEAEQGRGETTFNL